MRQIILSESLELNSFDLRHWIHWNRNSVLRHFDRVNRLSFLLQLFLGREEQNVTRDQGGSIRISCMVLRSYGS